MEWEWIFLVYILFHHEITRLVKCPSTSIRPKVKMWKYNFYLFTLVDQTNWWVNVLFSLRQSEAGLHSTNILFQISTAQSLVYSMYFYFILFILDTVFYSYFISYSLLHCPLVVLHLCAAVSSLNFPYRDR